MKNEVRKIIPFRAASKNLALNLPEQVIDEMAHKMTVPAYFIHIDENTGHLHATSVLTNTLTFERKKQIARAVSKLVEAI
jgi:hypothetical protein